MAAVLGIAGFATSLRLSIGDVDSGAPELRPDSRYNRDNSFMNANYAASSDVLVVMVQSPHFKCTSYDVLQRIDSLEWQLQQLTGVISTQSFSGLSKQLAVGLNEGSLKWYDLPLNQSMLNAFTTYAPREFFNPNCDLLPLYVYLQDHKADTLARATGSVERFASKNNTHDDQFLLAAGNAGIGVDYGLYVLAVLLTRLHSGMGLQNAYRATMHFTGKVVMLTGLTLAIATGIWAFSPIKFQADMGILLAFMFLWNLLGMLILLPTLSVFLLQKEVKSFKTFGH